MEITYYWEDMPVMSLMSAYDHINNGWFEPHETESYGEVEYEFEVTPKRKDYLDFLKTRYKDKFAGCDTKTVDIVLNALFDGLDLDTDTFDDDDEFREFISKRYEDEAKDAYLETYDY